jgi:ornithine cyclodeaminase
MGALWPAAGIAVVKSYLTVRGAFSFVVTGWDTQSNTPLFSMTGDEVTRLRTPALASLAVQRAARADATRLALFGAGLQGRAFAQAIAAERRFRHIDVVDLADVRGWCAGLSEQHRLSVQQTDAAGALAAADVIVTMTRAKTPLFDGRSVRPGTTVVAMGTSLPDASELDVALLKRADRVLVEWKPQSCSEAGEVRLLLGAEPQAIERISDLPQLCAGQRPWRGGADEIVVFKSVGVGLADAVAARALWQHWRRVGA